MNIINIKLYNIIPYNEPMIEKVTKVSAHILDTIMKYYFYVDSNKLICLKYWISKTLTLALIFKLKD